MKFFLFITLLLSCSAHAAGLRNFVTLTDQNVRLSDLFSGLAPGQDQIIGPAPSPGNRIIVPATQLAAIAGQFNVDWQSTSTADNVILDSPGQPMAADALQDPLHQALAARGAPARFQITLTGYAPPIVAPNDQIMPLVGSLDYNQANGNFSALITITGAKTAAFTMRVSGSVAELAQVPVLTRLLPAYQAIGADDITLATVRLPVSASGFARSADQVIGQSLRHVAQAGAPLSLSELTAPQAVVANALVEMDLQTSGLILQGRAIAEQSGAIGDMIRVRNPASRAVMMAEITGHNQVRVDPNSQPIVTTHNQELAER